MRKEIEFRESLQALFKTRQSRFIDQSIGIVLKRRNMKGQGEPYLLRRSKKVLNAWVKEIKISTDFSHALASLVLIPSQDIVKP